MAAFPLIAAIAAAAANTIGGISNYHQAKAKARARERQASSDADLAKQDFDLRIGAGRAQAGGSGLSLLGGSNEAIFNFNEMAKGDAVSDILFAGAADAANLRHEGKMALIKGFLGAGSEISSGISGAKTQKQKQDMQNKSITPTSNTSQQSNMSLLSGGTMNTGGYRL